MENSVFALFFFIIYDIILTWFFIYIYYKKEKVVKDQENYIDELLLELAKLRKK